MKSLKKVLALILAISAFSPIFAAQADIVVLMDSSGTILPFFDEINSKVLVDITKKFVQKGDTFHLISFNSRVNLEIVQPINSEEDLSKIISRFMLLYPLGQNSDFISGLHYTLQYVSSLDQQRDKIIIIISDGIFNPPESSPYASYTNEQVKTDIATVSRQIRGAGWSVFYIKLPFPEDAKIVSLDNSEIQPKKQTGAEKAENKSGSQKDNKAPQKQGSAATQSETGKQYYDISGEFTDSLGIEESPLPTDNTPVNFIDSVLAMPEVEFPGDLGKQGRVFVLPLRIKNSSANTLNIELTGVYSNDVNLLEKNTFLNLGPHAKGMLNAELHIPNTFTKGPQVIPVRLEFSDNLRVIPQSGELKFTLTGFTASLFLRAGIPLVISLVFVGLALILVVFLILFIARKTSKPASDAILASSGASAESMTSSRKPATATAKSEAVSASSIQSSAKASAGISAADAIIAGNQGGTGAKDYAALSSWKSEPRQYPGTIDTAMAQKTSNTQAAITASRNSEKIGAQGILAAAESASGKQTASTFGQDYVREAKHYPETAAARDTSADTEIRSLAENQAEEKKRRLSILSAAVAKKPHEAKITGAAGTDPITVKRNAKIMLELIVDRQNSHIGKRNIHMMKAGTRLAIGGGNSPFLIFLVKFPPRIAEIRYDGEDCTLAILKPQYFPDETANVITDCIGRTVKVISDKDYEITFSIRTYEDPVVRLNRVLTSIQY
jgi:hypothetical protein